MFIQKWSKAITPTPKSPVRRLFTSGFQQMGAVQRGVDTRNYTQMQNTIDYYAEQIPEVQKFAKEIKTLNPKDLGTICDTLELANYHAFLTQIEANVDRTYAKTLKETLLPQMIQASKENPAGMDLINAIINNTDATTAKYALHVMSGGVLNNKNLAHQMVATSKVVPDIAKETLSGGYTMDLSKQESFMSFIKSMVNKDTVSDKITSLFRDIVPVTESRPETFNIDVIGYLTSKADVEDIRARLKMLPKVLEGIGDKFKDFDLVKYLTKTEKS